MLRPLAFASRATLMTLFVAANPGSAKAIQLRWEPSATNLVAASNTRAMLVVAADSTEGTLPPTWQLQWVADTSAVLFTAVDSATACQTDTAKVSSIDAPTTPADSAANHFTAHFCSSGSTSARYAYFLVDLVGDTHGKMKVVALDPADPDSAGVIESNQVTFNGGVGESYAPIVLHASSLHQCLQLEVRVTGSGLEGANSLKIMASDSSWSLPLTITSQSEASITGSASVAAVLPACWAAVGVASEIVSGVSLHAEAEPAPESPLSSANFYEELLLPPPPGHGYTIQPKDFSMTRGFVDASSNRYALHLFYTRQTYYSVPADSDSRNLGHIWTTDFNAWYGPAGLKKADTTAIVSRIGKFDRLHVWAPTIVQLGPSFWMFYTGVDSLHHQRIGRATSTDLITWTQADTPVLTAPDVAWAKKDLPGNPYYGAQQIRDPYVMPDPANPGHWLMFFVAVDSLHAPKMAVGVATSPDLTSWAALPGPFSATERPTFKGATGAVESPHVFLRNGKWWMPYSVNQGQVFFETTASASPADTVATSWSEPVWLPGVAEGQPSELQYWHATEHLKIRSGFEYLAAFNDNASSIELKGVFPPADAAVDSFRLDSPAIAGVGNGVGTSSNVRFSVAGPLWGACTVRLRLELPAKMHGRLAAYDVAGRRIKIILDGPIPAGLTELAWDGRGQGGAQLASGVYFLRFTHSGGALVSKLLILR